MSPQLTWDAAPDRKFETGVDHGVLYTPTAGVYNSGVAWNGLVNVTETPSGAESNKIYADNMVYLNLMSLEEFGGTIEAYTYPDEFIQFDGGVQIGGLTIGQQNRGTFGLSYRTRVGDAEVGDTLGYKLHLVYGCKASPSERAYGTVNESPEAITNSWEFTTDPVPVTGMKNTSLLTIDSTKTDPTALAALEAILYGATEAPRLPLPDEVVELLGSEVTPVEPDFTGGNITIPVVPGVVYKISGVTVSGTVAVPSGQSKIVDAVPAAGYTFPAAAPKQWTFTTP